MTPKEKAKELYEQYEFIYIPNYTSSHEIKQCALIAVDEIISELEGTNSTKLGGFFWQEVKEEIEKL